MPQLVEIRDALKNLIAQEATGQPKTAQRYLDEAERDRSKYCHPGEEVTLANEVALRGRGGATFKLSAGQKGTVIRDMFGTGDVYYVDFGSCKAPINKADIA